MSSKIKVLPPQLINAIAAGEVIERPASVVKELIENAIDAESTEIIVRIQKGGRKLIQVADDGVGMSAEDVTLSIERHTTSKIHSLEDLFKIMTLGFRGEALSSIAAVSRLEIVSNNDESELGTHLSVKTGQIIDKKHVASPVGTTITVQDLFFNTPARLHFLKSDSTERAHISNVIIKYALAHPLVKFKLIEGNTPLISTSPSKELLDVIAQIFGIEVARELIPIDHTENNIIITGFISKPALTRKSRDQEFIFVNGRPVKDKRISQALEKGYSTFLPSKNYPIAFLFIQMDLSHVDVNVHPTKKEVRFSNEEEIDGSIFQSVKKTLSSHELIPEWREEDISTSKPEFTPIRVIPSQISKPRQKSLEKEIGLTESPDSSHAPSFISAAELIDNSSIMETEDDSVTVPLPTIREIDVSGIQIIGQAFDTYILLQQDSNLLIIDQHAMHERIEYERILSSIKTEKMASQKLLTPIKMNLSPLEAAILSQHMDFIEDMGFRINYLTGNTYLISGLPVILGSVTHGKEIGEIIHELMTLPSLKTNDPQKEEVVKMMACRPSIKAGVKLSSQEITSLIEKLSNTSNPYTCPHGRPTIINLSQRELEKKFKRK
ncbi:MAG: DNA mismatch repair endonuclease MutL [Promethearchaeota archaeon]